MNPGSWSYAARMAGREAAHQKGRLLMVVLCLAVGFSAFVATYGFSDRVLKAVQSESRSLLGADAVVSVQGLLDPALAARLQADPGVAAAAKVVDFPTLGSTGAGTTELARLLEVRAVEGPYPLQGKLTLTAGRNLGEALAQGVVVEASLAQLWALQSAPAGVVTDDLLTGNQALRLGGHTVPVTGVIAEDEARQASAFALGPSIYLGLERARELGLVTARARLNSRLLVNLRPGEEAAALLRLKATTQAAGIKARVQSHEEAAAQLAQPLRNLNRFIRQLGLLTLLLALMGSWAILAAFLEGRRKDAAILRCLGAPPELAHRTFGLLTLGLLISGGLLGTALGLGAAHWIPQALAELIPPALRAVSPGAAPRPSRPSS